MTGPDVEILITLAWAAVKIAALLGAAWVVLRFTEPFARRDHLVVTVDGVATALQERFLMQHHTLIRAGLTRDQAQRLARRLRLRREDTPERIG